MKTVVCRNCGAKISANETECPYCKTMQYDASEKKYMKNLYQMNNEMDQLDNDALVFIRHQTIRYVLILLAAIVIVIGLGAFLGYRKHLSIHDSAKIKNQISNSFQWYDENIDKLNQYVDSGDYSSAASLMNNYEIRYELLHGWEHYGLVYLYRNQYSYFDELSKKLDEKQEIREYTFKDGFDSAMEYLNTVTDEKNYLYTKYSTAPEADKAIMNQWVTKIELFFTNEVGCTKEEYLADLKQLYSNDSCDYTLEQQMEEKYYQMYLKYAEHAM